MTTRPDPFMQDSYGATVHGARPPIPPALGAGAEPAIPFPGIKKPHNDFEATRDGRRTTLLGYLVDLSIARSIAAGTHLTLNISGNVFFCDPLYDLTGNSQAGIARVHFQDIDINPGGTYVTALPNSLFKIPFTQILVENYAQAGKFLYVVYGVDADLQPGSSSQVGVLSVPAPLSTSIRDDQDAEAAIGAAGILGVLARGQVWDGAAWDRLRTPLVFKQFSATPGVGVNNIWTPAAGKKFRLMGYTFNVLRSSKAAATSDITWAWSDNGTALPLKELFTVDTTVPNPAQGCLYQSVISLGNGILSAAANNILQGQASVAFTAGGLNIVTWGTEE